MNDELREELVSQLGYDMDARMSGDCGAVALFKFTSKNGELGSVRTCELEADHEGVHEWDPDFEWDDEDEDEGRG